MPDKKYTVETGLNRNLQPVILCNEHYYDELIIEIRQLIQYHQQRGLSDIFIMTYPAIALLSTMPTYSEIKKQN